MHKGQNELVTHIPGLMLGSKNNFLMFAMLLDRFLGNNQMWDSCLNPDPSNQSSEFAKCLTHCTAIISQISLPIHIEDIVIDGISTSIRASAVVRAFLSYLFLPSLDERNVLVQPDFWPSVYLPINESPQVIANNLRQSPNIGCCLIVNYEDPSYYNIWDFKIRIYKILLLWEFYIRYAIPLKREMHSDRQNLFFLPNYNAYANAAEQARFQLLSFGPRVSADAGPKIPHFYVDEIDYKSLVFQCTTNSSFPDNNIDTGMQFEDITSAPTTSAGRRTHYVHSSYFTTASTKTREDEDEGL